MAPRKAKTDHSRRIGKGKRVTQNESGDSPHSAPLFGSTQRQVTQSGKPLNPDSTGLDESKAAAGRFGQHRAQVAKENALHSRRSGPRGRGLVIVPLSLTDPALAGPITSPDWESYGTGSAVVSGSVFVGQTVGYGAGMTVLGLLPNTTYDLTMAGPPSNTLNFSLGGGTQVLHGAGGGNVVSITTPAVLTNNQLRFDEAFGLVPTAVTAPLSIVAV